MTLGQLNQLIHEYRARMGKYPPISVTIKIGDTEVKGMSQTEWQKHGYHDFRIDQMLDYIEKNAGPK